MSTLDDPSVDTIQPSLARICLSEKALVLVKRAEAAALTLCALTLFMSTPPFSKDQPCRQSHRLDWLMRFPRGEVRVIVLVRVDPPGEGSENKCRCGRFGDGNLGYQGQGPEDKSQIRKEEGRGKDHRINYSARFAYR